MCHLHVGTSTLVSLSARRLGGGWVIRVIVKFRVRGTNYGDGAQRLIQS